MKYAREVFHCTFQTVSVHFPITSGRDLVYVTQSHTGWHSMV